MVKKILLGFIIWKVFTVFFAINVSHIFPDVPFYEAKNIFSERYHEIIWRFANMDGINYLRIAREGHNPSNIPFFPLYPLIIRFIADNFFHHRFFTPISQVISNLAFFISLLLIYKLLLKDGKRSLFTLVFVIIVAYPTSFFYEATYNDSLFLLFATLSLLAMRTKNTFLASIWAGFATYTRLNGLALFIALIAEYFSSINKVVYMNQLTAKLSRVVPMVKKAFSFKAMLSSKLYLTLIIPATFLYLLFSIQKKFGDWRLLFSTMKIWDQDRVILLPQVFWRYFKILLLYPTFKLNYWIAFIELFFVLFYIAILIYSFKKIRISYWIFMLVSFLIPSLTGTFAGMPRYGLHLYPLFLSIAILLKESNSWVRVVYLTVSLFLLCLMLGLYANGYFVS
ncbi:hypothetical protein HYW87_04175 [Candidatus Roizmanbacteria bacterium]|nr:hypothetical protein [Candidatus Roizmanbacteria bacterium]